MRTDSYRGMCFILPRGDARGGSPDPRISPEVMLNDSVPYHYIEKTGS
jgi:hypothetical protein